MKIEYIFLLLMPVMVTAGQILLKKNVAFLVTGAGMRKFIGSLMNRGIILGGVCVAAAPLLYIRALGNVPLSSAFAFNSLNYVLVFIFGRLFLRERIGLRQAAGTALISAGFLLPLIFGDIGA